jgi:DNA invertase Pin-like site-specific DNA recombinase
MARAKRTTSSSGTKPWAIYARLSKAANGDLETVERQIDDCRRHARRVGYRVGPVLYDNNLSAWRKGVKRPRWDELMQLGRAGEIAGILVWKVDRFTRRPRDAEDLIELAEDQGLLLDGPASGRFDLTTTMGRQQFRWSVMQAAAESDNTSERTRAALGAKRRAGKPMGGRRSFGFEPGGQVLVPGEVAVIRECARRVIEGESVLTLVKELDARGITGSAGARFDNTSLLRTLVKPRNAGLIEEDGEVVGRITGPDGEPLEPILDADTYAALNALVSSRRRGRPKSGKFLLTGLLSCDGCERPMGGKTITLRSGRRQRIYRCGEVYRGKDHVAGCGRQIDAEKTDQEVGDFMVRLLSNPKAVDKVLSKKARLGAARVEALAKVEAVEELLAELEVKFATEGESFRRAYERARPVHLRKLAEGRAALESLGTTARTTIDARADWDGRGTTDDSRRGLIQAFRVRITVDSGAAGGAFDPRRVWIGHAR